MHGWLFRPFDKLTLKTVCRQFPSGSIVCGKQMNILSKWLHPKRKRRKQFSPAFGFRWMAGWGSRWPHRWMQRSPANGSICFRFLCESGTPIWSRRGTKATAVCDCYVKNYYPVAIWANGENDRHSMKLPTPIVDTDKRSMMDGRKRKCSLVV